MLGKICLPFRVGHLLTHLDFVVFEVVFLQVFVSRSLVLHPHLAPEFQIHKDKKDINADLNTL